MSMRLGEKEAYGQPNPSRPIRDAEISVHQTWLVTGMFS
jgi:hypothetical protein